MPFITMGSGSLAATSIFETGYKDDLNEEEAINLVKDAIEAGIFQDMGSGSNVNISTLYFNDKREVKLNQLLHYRVHDKNVYSNPDSFKFSVGETPVLTKKDHKWTNIKLQSENVDVMMDIC